MEKGFPVITKTVLHELNSTKEIINNKLFNDDIPEEKYSYG